MIIGPLCVDSSAIQYAQYKWPRMYVSVIVGEVLFTLKFRCSAMEAAGYLRSINRFINTTTVSDGGITPLCDDGSENENERDDLGIEVDAKRIGFRL